MRERLIDSNAMPTAELYASALAAGSARSSVGYMLPLAGGRFRTDSLGDAEAENEVADVQVQQAATD